MGSLGEMVIPTGQYAGAQALKGSNPLTPTMLTKEQQIENNPCLVDKARLESDVSPRGLPVRFWYSLPRV